MTQIVLETLEPVDHSDLVQSDDVHTGPSRADKFSGGVAKRIAALRNVPNIGTYVGVLLVAAGAIMLAIAWGKVAGLTNVGLQVPYIVSAGFTGLGLIAGGLTVVNIAAKLDDARVRTRQVTELRELLGELRRVVEDER